MLPTVIQWRNKKPKPQCPIYANIYIKFTSTISLGISDYVNGKRHRKFGLSNGELLQYIKGLSFAAKETFLKTYKSTMSITYISHCFKYWKDVQYNTQWCLFVSNYLNQLKMYIMQSLIHGTLKTPTLQHIRKSNIHQHQKQISDLKNSHQKQLSQKDSMIQCQQQELSYVRNINETQQHQMQSQIHKIRKLQTINRIHNIQKQKFVS
eukprot:311000_1